MKPSTINSIGRRFAHSVSTPGAQGPILEPLEKLETSLYESLTSRKTKAQWDSLDLNVANNLSRTLEKYLQKTIQLRLRKPHSRFNRIPSLHIPPGYHQAYFNPAYDETALLPDGTDRVHSPGWPFEKRLWGGGSLIFNPVEKWMMRNGYLGILQEDIENVQVKGKEGEEKVFVTVSRKAAMGYALGIRKKNATQRYPPDLRTLDGTNLKEGKLGSLVLEEKKTLVFMRTKTEEELKQSLEAEPRMIKAPYEPDFQQALTPTAHLLFRFSALTFNAHRIHLDRQYAREVEGHRNLLVHGPLTQVLMLQVLRSQLDQKKMEMVYRFDYRNLAPLYADEKMKICTRRRPESPNKFDVWIEGPMGGLAVKATAEVGPQLEVGAEFEALNPNLSRRNPPIQSVKSDISPSLKKHRTSVHSFEMKSIFQKESESAPEPAPASAPESVESSLVGQPETESIPNQESEPEPQPFPNRQFETKSSLSSQIPERNSESTPLPPAEPNNAADVEKQKMKEEEVGNAYGYTATEIAELHKRKYSKDSDQDERFGW